MDDGLHQFRAPVLDNLPLVGTTQDLNNIDSLEYWRSIFGGVWGPVELTEIGGDKISGSLCSQDVGALTFNRITFGNQLFECIGGGGYSTPRDEPFYSLTFPQSGQADCFVGETRMRLTPNHAYLINVDQSAKLRVEQHYSTFNIQIPLSRLEHRLGRHVKILPRDILQSDPIYHLTKQLITELMSDRNTLDIRTRGFLTKQLLDTVAFFLTTGSGMSQESVAVQSVYARVMAFLDDNFHDSSLNPLSIAVSCGISRSYLYKVFSHGPSVMELLKRRRLEAAREMIEFRRDRLTLTTVAMSCGFSSSSEFSRLFKLEFGIKPSEL